MLKYIGGALITVGAFWILATAGASDQNLITFEEMVPQALLGLTILVGGLLLVRINSQLKKIRKVKRK